MKAFLPAANFITMMGNCFGMRENQQAPYREFMGKAHLIRVSNKAHGMKSNNFYAAAADDHKRSYLCQKLPPTTEASALFHFESVSSLHANDF